MIFEKYELEIEFSFNTRAKSIIDEFILNFDNMELFKPDEVHIIKNTFYTWKKMFLLVFFYIGKIKVISI